MFDRPASLPGNYQKRSSTPALERAHALLSSLPTTPRGSGRNLSGKPVVRSNDHIVDNSMKKQWPSITSTRPNESTKSASIGHVNSPTRDDDDKELKSYLMKLASKSATLVGNVSTTDAPNRKRDDTESEESDVEKKKVSRGVHKKRMTKTPTEPLPIQRTLHLQPEHHMTGSSPSIRTPSSLKNEVFIDTTYSQSVPNIDKKSLPAQASDDSSEEESVHDDDSESGESVKDEATSPTSSSPKVVSLFANLKTLDSVPIPPNENLQKETAKSPQQPQEIEEDIVTDIEVDDVSEAISRNSHPENVDDEYSDDFESRSIISATNVRTTRIETVMNDGYTTPKREESDIDSISSRGSKSKSKSNEEVGRSDAKSTAEDTPAAVTTPEQKTKQKQAFTETSANAQHATNFTSQPHPHPYHQAPHLQPQPQTPQSSFPFAYPMQYPGYPVVPMMYLPFPTPMMSATPHPFYDPFQQSSRVCTGTHPCGCRRPEQRTQSMPKRDDCDGTDGKTRRERNTSADSVELETKPIGSAPTTDDVTEEPDETSRIEDEETSHHKWSSYASEFASPLVRDGLMDTETYRLLSAVSPHNAVMTSMLRSHMHLLESLAASAGIRLNSSGKASDASATRTPISSHENLRQNATGDFPLRSKKKYTTLRDTHKYIQRHKKKVITFDEALELVKQGLI